MRATSTQAFAPLILMPVSSAPMTFEYRIARLMRCSHLISLSEQSRAARSHRSLGKMTAEQIAHRFLCSSDGQKLIKMQIKSARENARPVLRRSFDSKRKLPTGHSAASRTNLGGEAVFDDRQAPVLNLKDLSFVEVICRNGGKSCAALPALICLMNDDPVRRGDLPQGSPLVTDLTANLQTGPLS